MIRFRSSNPAFKRANNQEFAYSDAAPATYAGVTGKILYFLGMTILGAIGGIMLLGANPGAGMTVLSISGIFTFIFALVACLSPSKSKIFGSLYCLFQGALIGFISLVFESVVSGAIVSTLVATFAVLMVVSTVFMTGLVKVNSKFVKFVLTVTISFIFAQLILFIMSLVMNIQFVGGINLVVSGIMILLASFYLLIDLQNVVNIVEGNFPKEYEWLAAFGMVFTILWLYVELLPLIAQAIGDN